MAMLVSPFILHIKYYPELGKASLLKLILLAWTMKENSLVSSLLDWFPKYGCWHVDSILHLKRTFLSTISSILTITRFISTYNSHRHNSVLPISALPRSDHASVSEILSSLDLSPRIAQRWSYPSWKFKEHTHTWVLKACFLYLLNKRNVLPNIIKIR